MKGNIQLIFAYINAQVDFDLVFCAVQNMPTLPCYAGFRKRRRQCTDA
jgi:hypothetical protein